MTARYTHGHHPSVLRSHTWRTAQNSAAYLLPHLRPGMSLLDVGCGPGTITIDLARRVAPGPVLGIDTSSTVVDRARAAASAPDAPGNVTLAVGDLFDLGATDRRFDVVHAHQVLQHVAEPVEALRALRLSCAPEGIVAARDADYAAMFWYPHLDELTDWQRLYRAVARSNGGEPDAARRLPTWARAAGFAEIVVMADAWCFATGAERAWWADLWADRMEHSAVASRARESGLATADDLAHIAAGWRRWAADPDGIFVVPNVAILARNAAA